MQLQTPVVLILFNRPDLTELVFDAIAAQKPSKFLVIADGPRADREGEAENCRQARAVISKIDWPCEVLTNFSDVNLGCRKRVSSGIDWVFQNVEEAIILEDDCLPEPTFFEFCSEMLERYRNDPAICIITGDNFQPPNRKYPGSYYYSKYVHIWGWATWRRAWKAYDVTMAKWPALKQTNWLQQICPDPLEARYWINWFDKVSSGAIDTWDAQWHFACWTQNGLSITPSVNLISNLGFRADATHTIPGYNSAVAAMKTAPLQFPLRHPTQKKASFKLDKYSFDTVINDTPREQSGLVSRGVRLMRRVAKRIIRGRAK